MWLFVYACVQVLLWVVVLCIILFDGFFSFLWYSLIFSLREFPHHITLDHVILPSNCLCRFIHSFLLHCSSEISFVLIV